MSIGNYSAFENEIVEIFKTGSGDAEELGKRLAQAVNDYIQSIKFEVPAGSFVKTVVGQATGTPNPIPVEVTKK